MEIHHLSVTELNGEIAMTDVLARPQSTSEEPVSRFGAPDEEQLPPRVKAMYDQFLKSEGKVPNWIKAFAVHPTIMQRFLNYYGVLFDEKQGRLPMSEREMIAATVAMKNRCTYCTVHHTEGLAIQIQDSQRAQRIILNHHEVNLTTRETAILDFTVKVTDHPGEIHDADFQGLADAGLDREESIEVLEIAAFFGFATRYAAPLSILPDSNMFDYQIKFGAQVTH
jgi:uncharacterized peroxidase-related enzyme